MKQKLHYHLTEENPVIGLSFALGYHRLAVMVGETIVVTLDNLSRGDIDSEVYCCPPPYMLLQNVGHNEIKKVGGYVEKLWNGYLDVIVEGGYKPGEFITMFSDRPMTFMDNRLRNSLQSPYVYPTTSGGALSTFLTQALINRQRREAEHELTLNEMDWTVKKILNNGMSGAVSNKYKFTYPSLITSILPSKIQYLYGRSCKAASKWLNENYYFTSRGMLLKFPSDFSGDGPASLRFR